MQTIFYILYSYAIFLGTYDDDFVFGVLATKRVDILHKS